MNMKKVMEPLRKEIAKYFGRSHKTTLIDRGDGLWEIAVTCRDLEYPEKKLTMLALSILFKDFGEKFDMVKFDAKEFLPDETSTGVWEILDTFFQNHWEMMLKDVPEDEVDDAPIRDINGDIIDTSWDDREDMATDLSEHHFIPPLCSL